LRLTTATAGTEVEANVPFVIGVVAAAAEDGKPDRCRRVIPTPAAGDDIGLTMRSAPRGWIPLAPFVSSSSTPSTIAFNVTSKLLAFVAVAGPFFPHWFQRAFGRVRRRHPPA